MRKWATALSGQASLAAWVLTIALLPITSLPLLARLSGADSVSAASALPLLFLLIFWFIPFILRRGKIPLVTVAFLALVTVMLLSTVVATFIDIPPFRGRSIGSREVQAVLTLAVGASFYIAASAWPNTERRLQMTLQVINWSGLILLAWSLLQGYFWYRYESVPQVMWDIQGLFSLNGFYYRRVNGFAYEPSWLGHQLNMLYLPLWLSATIQGKSVHRFRLFKTISLENVLALLGIATLFLTQPRIGLAAFLLMVAFLGIGGAIKFGRRIQKGLVGKLSAKAAGGWFARAAIATSIVAVFLVVFFGGSYGLVRVAGRYDPRVARMFNPSTYEAESVYRLANNLSFAERLVFWATGWEVFNRYPLMGVGLGNSGFYFPQTMPAFGWSLTEVNTDMFRVSVIPNTKSLWTRLISETGIVGFAFFLGWLYLIWYAARMAHRTGSAVVKTVGLAGSLGLIALVAEGFSVDSLALPYIWVITGLVSAASSLSIVRYHNHLIDGRVSEQDEQ
jgi:hypothetical protein